MSSVKSTENLRWFEKSLVHGYWAENHDGYTPVAIIQLTLLYCFILDEFKVNDNNSKCILGLNNTICIKNKKENEKSDNPNNIHKIELLFCVYMCNASHQNCSKLLTLKNKS